MLHQCQREASIAGHKREHLYAIEEDLLMAGMEKFKLFPEGAPLDQLYEALGHVGLPRPCKDMLKDAQVLMNKSRARVAGELGEERAHGLQEGGPFW